MINLKNYKFLILSFSLFLASLSISGLTTNAREETVEERLFKRLEFAITQGRLKESKADIKRVLKLNPHHEGATFYAGKYAFAHKDFENALKFLKRVENSVKYGSEARKMLADIRLSAYRKKFFSTLEVAIKGQAYNQALQICERILEEMPKNEEALFLGAYAATMQGYSEQAEEFSTRFSQVSKDNEKTAELKAFIDAMFSIGYSPAIALEKLMSITDRRLLSMPVRKRIKDLIVSLKEIDQFEKFIEREKSRPDANISQLERELIGFLIEQKQFEKALELINQRPANQLEDNLLYVKLLALTGKEEKAMLTTRHLMSANPMDLRLYEAWVDSWLSYVDRTATLPSGLDAAGKSIPETAEEILERLKMDKLVRQNPALLLKLLRFAVLNENEGKVKEIRSEAVRISFNNELIEILQKTVDGLIDINRSSLAADLLESARNQLYEEHSLSIKLAEIYYINNNPETSAAILEGVLQEKPDMTKALLLWSDCMALLGEFSKAEQRILVKLAEPELNDIVKRQLENKLEVIRMQQFGENEQLRNDMQQSEELTPYEDEAATEEEKILDMLEEQELD